MSHRTTTRVAATTVSPSPWAWPRARRPRRAHRGDRATGPASVQAEQVFQVTGSGCVADDPENPDYEAGVILFTDMTDLADENSLVFIALLTAEGDWTAEVAFPAGTPAGAHEVYAGCDYSYSAELAEYPTLTVDVTKPATTPPTTEAPKSDAPAPGAIRGASANTAGVAAQTTGATTKDA